MNDTCSVDGAMNDYFFIENIIIFKLNDLTSDEVGIH